MTVPTTKMFIRPASDIWLTLQRFGGAACQSPSLGWPLHVDVEAGTGFAGFHFENETLKHHWHDHLPQKIVLDVGGLENDPVFQVRSFVQVSIS